MFHCLQLDFPSPISSPDTSSYDQYLARFHHSLFSLSLSPMVNITTMFEYVWKCFKETSHDCVPHGSIDSFSFFFFFFLVYSSLHAVHVTNKLSIKVLGIIADDE